MNVLPHINLRPDRFLGERQLVTTREQELQSIYVRGYGRRRWKPLLESPRLTAEAVDSEAHTFYKRCVGRNDCHLPQRPTLLSPDQFSVEINPLRVKASGETNLSCFSWRGK
jgi:hypothetical protein